MRKTTMTRTIAAALAAVLTLATVGCYGEEDPAPASDSTESESSPAPADD